MRFFVFWLLGMGIWVNGATVSSYVDDEGVTVLTNLEKKRGSVAPVIAYTNSSNFVPLINRVASRHGVD